MSFFQNVSESQFRGVWVLGDRQYSLDFDAPPNANRSNYQLSWLAEPYNFTGGGVLTLNYAWDLDFKNYSSLAINCVGAVPGATTSLEVVNALNANAIFSEMFVAQLYNFPVQANGPWKVLISAKRGRIKSTIRVYVSNGGAEGQMTFNAKAPVVQLPLYMARHTIANRFAFPDSTGQLVQLSHRITSNSLANPTVITIAGHGLSTGNVVYIGGSNSTPSVNGTYSVTVLDANTFTIPVNVTKAGDQGEVLSAVENAVVTAAGFVVANASADWQLLTGRASGIFSFQTMIVDGSNRTLQLIECGAGAVVGDLARKTNYVYTGANTAPSQVTQIPYVLQAGDLVTPP